MKEEEIKKGVKSVFFKVFTTLKEKDFDFEKSAEDIKDWDSLSHMTLVSELEKEFGLTMEIDDISEMDSVKNVVNLLKRKLGVKK